MVGLIEQARLAVDELIDATGWAAGVAAIAGKGAAEPGQSALSLPKR
jgi:hypothetical protein